MGILRIRVEVRWPTPNLHKLLRGDGMVQKRTMTIVVVLAVIFSVVATFTVSNRIQVDVGDKVLITQDEYQELISMREDFKGVVELQNHIEQNFYVDTSDIDFVEGMKRGIFEALDDPYSIYMNDDEYSDFIDYNKGSYGGIGVIVSPGEDGLITVVSPIEDTPGERAGLEPGDKIIKVYDQEVSGEKIDEAISIMKGEPGTEVQLSIKRNGERIFKVDIIREEITLKAVKSEVKDDDIGYLRLSMFDEKSSEEFEEHLEGLLNQGIKGLVIDLRNNPGGSLSECVKIADRILGKQVIVYTKDNKGDEEYEHSDPKKLEIPYTLLVNGGSASASEIVTGAVKDSHAGTVIGTKTFGKGLVQAVNGLRDGAGFKLTVAQYFTPNGSYIHGEGIEPDIVIEFPEEIEDDENGDPIDVQLEKAIEVLKEKM